MRHPRPAPSRAERIIAEVMFAVGLLALAEILVRGFDRNRLLITVALFVVGYAGRGLVAMYKRWWSRDDTPPQD